MIILSIIFVFFAPFKTKEAKLLYKLLNGMCFLSLYAFIFPFIVSGVYMVRNCSFCLIMVQELL